MALDTAEEQVVVVAQPPAHSADTQHLGCFLATCRAHGVEETLLQIGTAETLDASGSDADAVISPSVCQFEQRVQQQVWAIQETLGTVRHVHEFGGQRVQLFEEFVPFGRPRTDSSVSLHAVA